MAQSSHKLFTESLVNLPQLKFEDIHKICDTHSLTKRSKMDKGYKFFIEGYIFNYEVSNIVQSAVTVRGRCHRSMKKNEEAHHLQVLFQQLCNIMDRDPSITFNLSDVPFTVQEMSCSCAAGRALCNHLVAVLYQTAHYRAMGFKSVPVPLSCTSTLQRWHRPRTQGIAPESTTDMMVKKSTKTTTKFVKSIVYKAYSGPLPDPHIMASMKKLEKVRPQPGICKLLHGLDSLKMVDSKFGPVPFGSVLSYQFPPDSESRDIIKHSEAQGFPTLPVEGYGLKNPFTFQPNYVQKCHLESLKVSLHLSAAIEEETRPQSQCPLWGQVRRPRLTASRFREVCHVRGVSSAQNLAARILKGTPQTAAMKRGLELEPEILQQYSDSCDVSVMQCGVIIHPDAPHLAATPDAKVFDPKGCPPFGLAEVKACDVDNVEGVKHLRTMNGKFCLKKSHKYYFQVQGQLAITGLQWCDFITDTRGDITVERLHRDEEVIQTMRPQLDNYYYNTYMDEFIQSKR